MGYVRENLVYGRTFLNDADLAQQCADWLAPVANARRHATTQERPRARFERDKRAVLQPVPSRRYTSLVLDAPAMGRALARPTPPVITVEKRPLTAYARLAGGGLKTAPLSRRARRRQIFADLRMPGALEALDAILRDIDGGALTAPDAIEQLLLAQIQLRNIHRLQAAMGSSRLPAVKQLGDFAFTFQPSLRRDAPCSSFSS